ncbi:cinnamoyl-Coa reductase [Dionaea muscipula]
MAADPQSPPAPPPPPAKPEAESVVSAAASDALVATLRNSIDALGRGFDVTSDIRLLYCKGSPASRLVHIEERRRDIVISDELVVENVSVDVEFSRGKWSREATPVWSFLEMSEHFNELSGISGSIPIGSFNAMFSYTGSWQNDEAATKSLAMVGYFIPLYKLQLSRSELILQDEVKRAVPNAWVPVSLASFIEKFGTHVVTSVTIGGRDVVYLRQHQSSSLSAPDIEKYVKDIGDQRFMDLRSLPSAASGVKHQDKDVTVIFRRRGGDDLEQSPAKWAETVEKSPDVINMTFTPIISLLNGVPGLKHLSHAIDLYLEYKPPIPDLRYFLEFQIAQAWAPEQSKVQRKEPACPHLQFSLMGPKLYVSLDQVAVGRKPVTGLRLRLEGSKQNRLAIHLQHLVSLPKILQPHWDSHMAIGVQIWRGPEEQDSRWFEPIKWKQFSYVSTAPIEHKEASIGDLSGAHIVTGAQLGVWNFGSRSVLYLKLLFSKVPGCTIRQSVWDHNPAKLPATRNTLTTNETTADDKEKLDATSVAAKLTKLVDCTEMLKGPQDSPGHWLVTGGKLGIDKGRILLRAKYSLLNY